MLEPGEKGGKGLANEKGKGKKRGHFTSSLHLHIGEYRTTGEGRKKGSQELETDGEEKKKKKMPSSTVCPIDER